MKREAFGADPANLTKIALLPTLLSFTANSAVTPHTTHLSTEDLARNHFTGFRFKNTISSKGATGNYRKSPDTQLLVEIVPSEA